QEADQYVACTIHVPVDVEVTMGTVEVLTSPETLIQTATAPTCLACVRLVDNDHLTPGVLTCLVQQALLEAVVGPCGHGTRRLGTDAALASTQHLRSLECLYL